MKSTSLSLILLKKLLRITFIFRVKSIIEFKDDATAFNALKKEKFEGKGRLNCLISARIFEILINKNIPTHFIELKMKIQ